MLATRTLPEAYERRKFPAWEMRFREFNLPFTVIGEGLFFGSTDSNFINSKIRDTAFKAYSFLIFEVKIRISDCFHAARSAGSANPAIVYQLKVGKLTQVMATYGSGDYLPYTHADYRFGYNGIACPDV